jgi:4-hydroxybenzoate polyprenyltransferase
MEAGAIGESRIRPYVEIARVDHWFKNIFVLPGIVSGFLLEPATQHWGAVPRVAVCLLATCLVASSNYVLNEILDAPTDRFHPAKRTRPVPSGRVNLRLAYLEWIALGAAGLGMGATIGLAFFLSLLSLWVMGLVYNVPPVRSKEIPYLDVLSEALNNPIRFLLGWYGVQAAQFPPSSFLLAYWIIGAYLMTAKRLAEFRQIGDPEQAGRYRASFRLYTESQLATAMLTFAAGFMFFVGVILVKYHVEFILACPLLLVYLGYYNSLAYQEDSVAQNPEKLYRDPKLMFLTLGLAVVLWGLSVITIPDLSEWLGISRGGW